jgi:hypothetical protein
MIRTLACYVSAFHDAVWPAIGMACIYQVFVIAATAFKVEIPQ